MTTSLMIRAAVAALATGVGLSTQALAVEYGTVVSRTPVYGAVSVPEHQCFDQQQLVRQRPTGAGALIGALVGGGIGNAIGAGAGRAAATGIGAVAGAVIGDRAEANATPPVAATVRQCQTVSRVENRLIGYDVVYDYNGRRHTARLPNDPGERIALNVNVAPVDAVPQGAGVAPAPPPVYRPPPVYVPPAPVYAPPPVVYAPAPSYYYGPPAYFAPSIGLVIGGGWGHRHWH
jgi:uncharacterized protein YcfJ